MADFHSATMSVITNDLTLGDETNVVRGGDPQVVAPPHTSHAFKNTGADRLITVDIHASPVFETEWL